MITVVIATRNRPKSLKNILLCLENQSLKPNEVIIVDSSLVSNRLNHADLLNYNFKIKYLNTTIESAAKQRNMGLENVSKETSNLFILDDDVEISVNYIAKLSETLKNYEAIGVSGIAINEKFKKPKNNLSILKKLFFLDSPNEGVITKGGINIPIRSEGNSAKVFITQWLIGCSLWDFKRIKYLKYQEEFYGQSLFEDVIFSLQASRLGKLLVNTEIVLNHSLNEIGRPNEVEFYKMWVFNRVFVMRELNPTFSNWLFYHWTNFGKFIHIFLGLLINPKNSSLKIFGIVLGYAKFIQEILGK